MAVMLLANWLQLSFLVTKIVHNQIVTEKLLVAGNMLHQAWLVHGITNHQAYLTSFAISFP